MKDPAFLFYTQDFIVGVQTMNFEERGKYITILSLMHQQGRMSEETISFLVGCISVNLKSKFCVDENGLWYNKRLETETEKRKKFIESRVVNGKLGGRPKDGKIPIGKPLGLASANLIENEIEIENIIEYLNEKSGKKFRTNSDKTRKVILTRLNEKYTVSQFKKVIDIKCLKWKDDPKMCDYLRPETLFGNKFESYLNEVPIIVSINSIQKMSYADEFGGLNPNRS